MFVTRHRLLPVVLASVLWVGAGSASYGETAASSLGIGDVFVVGPAPYGYLDWNSSAGAAKRLLDISYRLRVGSQRHCATRVAYEIGLSYLNLAGARLIALREAENLVGLDERPAVVQVVTDSAASKADIRVGDIIEKLNDVAVPAGGEGANLLQAELDRVRQSGASAKFLLQRGTSEVTATVLPEKACDFSIAFTPELYIAWTAGSLCVGIRASMMEAPDDAIVAFVMAHQAAHGLMGHDEKLAKAMNQVQPADVPLSAISLLLGIVTLGGWPAKPIEVFGGITEDQLRGEFEPKADLLAVHMLTASGYPPAAAAAALQRAAARKEAPSRNLHVKSNFFDQDTALTRQRIEVMQREAVRINDAIERGVPESIDSPQLEEIFDDIRRAQVPSAKTSGVRQPTSGVTVPCAAHDSPQRR
jgi:hypothetical protein